LHLAIFWNWPRIESGSTKPRTPFPTIGSRPGVLKSKLWYESTLEFNLPDEQEELDAAVKIIEVKSCLDEICKTVWPGSAESVSRHFRVVKSKVTCVGSRWISCGGSLGPWGVALVEFVSPGQMNKS
jgi:hypothetical protein